MYSLSTSYEFSGRHYIDSAVVFGKILEQSDKTEKQKQKELTESVYKLLSDLARTGAPMTYTALQYCQLLELALEKPEKYNRPINDWTARELQEESIKQGIFENISITQVGNFLKGGRFKTTSDTLLAESECGKCKAIRRRNRSCL